LVGSPSGACPEAPGFPWQHSTGRERHRALVIIAFFRLDDHRRQNLFLERAKVITSMYAFAGQAEVANDPAVQEAFEDLITAMLWPSSSHANCASSFRRLIEYEPQKAEGIFLDAARYINSKLP
jgi:hypothetical protein